MASRYREQHLELPTEFVAGRIGVVTVLYNSAEVLPEFFASVEIQNYPLFAVYCVDNGSKDESVTMCRSRGDRYIVIENGRNAGVAAGNNIGTRAAVADGCEFVLYLNNDVMFGAELFTQLVEGMRSHDCSMTTPLVYYHDRPNVIWAAGGRFQRLLGYRCLHFGDGDFDEGQYRDGGQIAYTPTCCVLVRRELFATVGLMDERYFLYWDDTDFMLRAYQQGERLYLLTQAKLWHKVSSLVGASSPFRTRYVHRNHGLYLRKHWPAAPAYLLSFGYWVGYIALSLLGRISFAEAADRIRYWREGLRAERLSLAE